MDNPATPTTLKTVAELLNEIQSYFAILANTERVSLSDTEEPDVLCLRDATEIGGTGLDLVEELRSRLEKAADEAVKPAVTAEADPLTGLKELPLDRVVTVHLNSRHSLTGAIAEGPEDQMVLFEPRTGTSCQYHMVPFASISAWSEMRGENAEPLFLYGREYLTRQKIIEKERSRGGVCG
ncbi:hypothetical protein [Microvirga calopogonii]|uniref:hypothetical protein n=1 Tax=Microvirga calopogonii TaxID=2078013 RepID=UPI000E0CE018|nr:hypothetical protein [Microvirga calopogonii]